MNPHHFNGQDYQIDVIPVNTGKIKDGAEFFWYYSRVRRVVAGRHNADGWCTVWDSTTPKYHTDATDSLNHAKEFIEHHNDEIS